MIARYTNYQPYNFGKPNLRIKNQNVTVTPKRGRDETISFREIPDSPSAMNHNVVPE
jgi:hypothetical protein